MSVPVLEAAPEVGLALGLCSSLVGGYRGLP